MGLSRKIIENYAEEKFNLRLYFELNRISKSHEDYWLCTIIDPSRRINGQLIDEDIHDEVYYGNLSAHNKTDLKDRLNKMIEKVNNTSTRRVLVEKTEKRFRPLHPALLDEVIEEHQG